MTDGFDLPGAASRFSGHSLAIGQRYVAHGDDWAELALDYDPRLAMAVDGVLASGPIISLIDTTSGLSITAKTKRARRMATLDLRIDYLRAAPPGRAIHARATCYRVTRHIGFVRCHAHDGDPDDLVAVSMSSFFFSGD